jgi:RNA polymerase sigma factor (sigma-70 family)
MKATSKAGAARVRAPAQGSAELESLYVGLVRTYHRDVQGYAHALLGDEATAEDITQEAFLRAYLALPRLGAPDNPRAWLLRIATNLIIDRERRRARLRWIPLDRVRHALGVPDRSGDLEAMEPVREALAAISADQRSVLLLFAHLGLTAPQVAEVLGISPAAARKRRQRAREAFTRAYHEAKQ